MNDKHQPGSQKFKALTSLLSVLLHPLFMPLLASLFLYYLMPESFAAYPSRTVSGWLGMMIINTVLFPLVLVLLLKGLGFVKSIYLRESKERIIPLIGTMIFYFWPYLVAKNVAAPLLARTLLLGNFWGIVLVFIATIFFKISMHTSALAAVLGFLTLMSFSAGRIFWAPLMLMFALLLIISWARCYSGAHSVREIIAGIVLGLLIPWAAYWYL